MTTTTSQRPFAAHRPGVALAVAAYVVASVVLVSGAPEIRVRPLYAVVSILGGWGIGTAGIATTRLLLGRPVAIWRLAAPPVIAALTAAAVMYVAAGGI